MAARAERLQKPQPQAEEDPYPRYLRETNRNIARAAQKFSAGKINPEIPWVEVSSQSIPIEARVQKLQVHALPGFHHLTGALDKFNSTHRPSSPLIPHVLIDDREGLTDVVVWVGPRMTHSA